MMKKRPHEGELTPEGKPYYLTEAEKAEMLRDVRAKLAQANAEWDGEHPKKEETLKQ